MASELQQTGVRAEALWRVTSLNPQQVDQLVSQVLDTFGRSGHSGQ